MQNLQYDLFTEKSLLTAEESHNFRLEMKHLNAMANNVRRGVFARLNEQSKLIMKMVQEIEELKGKKKPIILDFSETEPSLFRKYK